MTVLLLGGTGDAKRIAQRLADENVKAVVTLAGATRDPDKLPLPTIIGGFGGRSGFEQFLKDHTISKVLDATHPFASQITERTVRVCKDMAVSHCLFVRAPWEPDPGDNWIEISQEEDAKKHISIGQTVFLGTGRQTLARFSNLEGCRVICRQIDSPESAFPFEGGEFLVGRPPFSVEHEIALFKERGVDWLVVKNAGGELSRSKLIAARRLGIPVLMIKRPPLPDAKIVSDVESAIGWAKG